MAERWRPLLLVIMMVTGSMASCTGDDTDAAPRPTATTPTEADASRAPTSPPTAPFSGLAAWSDAIDLPLIGDTSNVQGLAVRDGELIAVGFAQSGDERRGGLWRSRDGVTWTVDPDAFTENGQWPRRIVSLSDRMVAIGSAERETADGTTNRDAIGWTSNDGTSWERIAALPATDAAEFAMGVAVVGGEVWIAGYRQGSILTEVLSTYRIGDDGTVLGPDAPEGQWEETEPLIDRWEWGAPSVPFLYRSGDCINWEEVPVAGIDFGELHAVAASADGSPIVAGVNAADRITVWRGTGDGRWTALSPGVPASGRQVRSLLEWSGYLVVGISDGSGAVRAPNGRWTTLPAFTFADVADAGDRLVTVGWSRIEDGEDSTHVAESTDAFTWSGIELAPNQYLSVVVSFGDGLVAAGSYPNPSGDRVPAVWTGGSRTESLRGNRLTGATWQAPQVPTMPTADLLRFDGTSWVAVLTNDDLGGAELQKDMRDLDLDRATDVAVTGDGAVWVATEQQGIFRLRDDTWTRFGVDEGLPAVDVRTLVVGPGGAVVAATAAGLVVFNGERFVPPALPLNVEDPRVLDLVAAGDMLWAATGSGLVSWDGAVWRYHGADLPGSDVVGGELPAGLARRLYATETGVAADFPGIGWAAWDGSSWTMLDLPHNDRVATVGWDGSVFYGVADGISMDLFRWYPDGTVERPGGNIRFGSVVMADDGTVWVPSNIEGVYEIRGGSATLHSSLDGTRLSYVGRAWVFGNRVFVKVANGTFVYADGTWTKYLEAEGLDYPLTGHDRSLSTGAIHAMAQGPDGTIWALSREQLAEWEES